MGCVVQSVTKKTIRPRWRNGKFFLLIARCFAVTGLTLFFQETKKSSQASMP